LLSTLIGLGGYLPMIVKLFFASPVENKSIVNWKQAAKISNWMFIPVALLASLVVIIGIYPAPWINWVGQVIAWMLI